MSIAIALWHELRAHLVSVLLVLFTVVCWNRYSLRPHSWNASPKQRVLNYTATTLQPKVTNLDGERSKLVTTPTAVFSTTSAFAANPIASVPQLGGRRLPKRIVGKKNVKHHESDVIAVAKLRVVQPIVFYFTIAGSTEKLAKHFAVQLRSFFTLEPSKEDLPIIAEPEVLDLSGIDLDDYFSALPRSTGAAKDHTAYFYILLVPTYNVDSFQDSIIQHLNETHHDFRIDTGPISDLLGYAVFGLGDKNLWPTELDGFCRQAKEIDTWLARLTRGKRAYPLGLGDVASDANSRLDQWREGVQSVIADIAEQRLVVLPDGDGAVNSDEEDMVSTNASASLSKLQDLESIRALEKPKSTQLPLAIDFTTYSTSASVKASQTIQPLKEMVPKASPTYAALTKQGYSIVGSHSASKTCRWTKSALRGRGSCYKFSFYGIKSHLCMEATPSLSCSNKCVFCWRHGTNPVGTTWRWQVDPPDLVFSGIKEGHYKKIKEMRGVPGVRAERFEEAMTIRHCALSLVGEPIFYPHINALLDMLHAEQISTFLVCNAQHPDQLEKLQRVTQLYVSIDASNRESLRKIDRPLHRDFWERFCRCLDILHAKRFQQRTVFRLTLVKGFNVEDEAEGYAALVERGLPCFVEVKGVTYCGTSTSAGVGLTMKNVPFYEEVKEFVYALDAALQRRGLGYGIAAEHAHSCCILIASTRFRTNGIWNTSIDYSRFFELLTANESFVPEDYMSPTPSFAVFGQGGFNPEDVRVDRKGNKKELINI